MKTFSGYLLRLLGLLFAISCIGNILNIVRGDLPESTIGKVEIIAALIIAAIVSYICFKYGNRKLDEVKRAQKKKN